MARASAVPSRIPENDGFQTLATLDATNSADPIDDPDGEHSLTYRWSIEADEFRFEEGAERSAIASVRFRGDRPALVSLTATDEDGLSNTASFQMQLTIE